MGESWSLQNEELDPGQLAVAGPSWLGGSDQITSRGTFQPQTFHDSVIRDVSYLATEVWYLI